MMMMMMMMVVVVVVLMCEGGGEAQAAEEAGPATRTRSPAHALNPAQGGMTWMSVLVLVVMMIMMMIIITMMIMMVVVVVLMCGRVAVEHKLPRGVDALRQGLDPPLATGGDVDEGLGGGCRR
jgi:hypothetical protein